jgi:hypothetical protein
MTERHHALDGCLNLRDVGGYLTAEGRQVRWGCLYRSGELCSLTDADLDAVGRLGVRVVVDLRNRWERVARPGRLPPGVELVERPSPPTGRARGRTLEEQIVTGDLPVKDDEYLTTMYVGLLDRLAPEVRLVLELAVDARRATGSVPLRGRQGPRGPRRRRAAGGPSASPRRPSSRTTS